MSRRRAILILIGLAIAGGVVAFFDPIRSAYSAVTDTPRSWIKSSSPMKGHLAYVWEHWGDADLKNSDAVRQLSAIVGNELSANSTSEEIRAHIEKHFQRPVFSGMGVAPATQWRQDAHGYTAFFMDDYRVLHVRYFSRDDRFLYADVCMGRPKGTDLRQVDLTPSVDLWDVPAKPKQ